MDLILVKKGVAYTQKRKKWAFLLAALGFSGYSAFKVYHLPSLVKKRKTLVGLLGGLLSLVQVVADSAEAIAQVTKDVNEFILSDSDKIPNSLTQISKLAQSDEFLSSLTGLSKALSVGIMRGYDRFESVESVSLMDQVFDKMFSPAGSGFASVVVGSFVRNLVITYYSDTNNAATKSSTSSSSDSVSKWVDVVCDKKCRNLIGDCIEAFVSTAVSAYLDNTMNINTYDSIFSGLTNPKHEKQVRETLTALTCSAVETLVRTSHQVLKTSSSTSWQQGDQRRGMKSFNDDKGKKDGGWVKKMSSTLAMPSNRRFVLDMTGRLTFETVRSFLEFLLRNLSESLKNNVNVVHDEVIDKGLEVVRCVTAKSSAVATICLSFCLHILNGPWILVPI